MQLSENLRRGVATWSKGPCFFFKSGTLNKHKWWWTNLFVPIVDGRDTEAGPGPWNSAAIGPRLWPDENVPEPPCPLISAGDIFNCTLSKKFKSLKEVEAAFLFLGERWALKLSLIVLKSQAVSQKPCSHGDWLANVVTMMDREGWCWKRLFPWKLCCEPV